MHLRVAVLAIGIKPSSPRSGLVAVPTAPICVVLGSVKYS